MFSGKGLLSSSVIQSSRLDWCRPVLSRVCWRAGAARDIGRIPIDWFFEPSQERQVVSEVLPDEILLLLHQCQHLVHWRSSISYHLYRPIRWTPAFLHQSLPTWLTKGAGPQVEQMIATHRAFSPRQILLSSLSDSDPACAATFLYREKSSEMSKCPP